ncbi:YcdB/YcdC domain-containing protein [Psychrobacillus psychrodurans]|uniref:S-layer homology domain-containing protein n=1 Tax=Psychrobacillus psychrodurans TaxID=126157 RepID=A0A9X3RBC2_9BACI|nr:YcdB/YcdC domain-containing protein [Psychrobacillus psychrodurans]MCZ8535051.1 S-layer homology domain-containing protein [Psychrobacillus psychrodurans]
MKKIGIILTASVLSIGMFSSATSAVSTVEEQLVAQVASTGEIVTKEDLLKKFRSTFPGIFDFVNASDFHMSSNTYPEDETTRYHLFFNKLQNGKDIHGSIGFYGEDFEIESFNYDPVSTPDALFPAKFSKEEAKKVATDFVKKFLKDGNYKLGEDYNDYFNYSKQILTRPISYSFSFNRMKDDVEIADQSVSVTVLGNGEIVGFSGSHITKSPTFEDVKKVNDRKEALEKVKGNLTAKLQYQVNTNYETGENDVKLVYVPDVLSINAITGEWFNGKEFVVEQPNKKKYVKVTETALPAKHNGITKEEAKKSAEKLLQVKSNKVKLSIQSVEEVKNSNGQEIFSVHYMYNYGNSGSGSTLEFDKKTGELLQYHNTQNGLLVEMDETKEEVTISKEEAIAQAVKYLKELVPSYLHEYAMPLEEGYHDETMGNYYITFPRIVNGVMVMGDQISVNIHKDGSLDNLNVVRPQIEEWPSLEGVISTKEAEDILNKALNIKMSYWKENQKKENKHYNLIYSPTFNETAFNVLDANSGNWINQYHMEVTPEVSHPTAAEELNYLIKAKVLTVNDPKTFNGDATVSRGEAIKIMMNSLTYIYETSNHRDSESIKQSYTNVDPKHASYQAIERAVEAGILKTDQKTFDLNSPITKEELAVWYIRALGLEQAAKQNNIFINEFTDSKKVKVENTGYVVLAHSLGLVKAEKNQFNPIKEVTYADLAVSSIRLAYEIANKGRDFRYDY